MAVYSFKSVGKTRQQSLQELQTSKIPYGIKTPMEFGANGEGIFAMNYDIEDQLSDNLRNLLLTNWGERVNQYYFGANLRPLTTEFTSQEDFDNLAIERIRAAVGQWMPFISLTTFESIIDRTENKNTAVIKININYRVPVLEVADRAIQIVLYAI